MAIKLIVTPEELGQLPEAFQKEYKQHTDGTSFILDTVSVGGFAVENIKGLTSALEKERATGRDALAQLKNFEGIDAAKAREALTRLDEIAKFNPQEKIKAGMDEWKKQILGQHQEQLSEAEKREKAIKGQLRDVLVSEKLTRALSEAKGSIPLLLPQLQSHIRMREQEGGQMIPEVIDPKTGTVRVGDIISGAPMTIPQLVSEFKSNPDYAPAFLGTGSTGSGSNNGDTGSPSRPPTPGAPRVVSLNDHAAMDANFNKIATGEVTAE